MTKSFGNVVAIQGVTFEVGRGEIVGLVGDNGAGKSTLVKVMNGFYPPDKGEIRFDGRPVQIRLAARCAQRRHRDGVPGLGVDPGAQHVEEFFSRSGNQDWRSAVQACCRRGEMREIAMENLREMGLTRLRSPDEPVDILSGGERQALAIARARYFGGSLLLLDEPTSALSVKETEKVSEAVHIARDAGLGVVIIDHNIGHVHGICDRIVIMEAGRVLRSVRREDVTAQHVVRYGGRKTCALKRRWRRRRE